MKKRSLNARNRVMTLATVGLICIFTLASFIVSADDDEKKAKGYFFFGWGLVDEDNVNHSSGLSAGRVSEYNFAENAALMGLNARYATENGYFQTENIFFNTEEMASRIVANGNRMFFADIDFRSFTHRLDGDTMADWNQPFGVSAQAAGEELEMRATLLNSDVRFKPESIPGSVFFLHVRLVAREGNRQARTFDHCTSCHVNTNTQALDQRTLGAVVGMNYNKKPFAVSLTHTQRDFNDSSDSMTFNWANIFNNFDLEGLRPYSVTPDNELTRNAAVARVDFGAMTTVSGKFSSTEVENQNTGYKMETTSFSGRLNMLLAPWLRLRGSYDYRDATNDTPLSAAREVTRFAGSAIVTPRKGLKFEGSYRSEEVKRSGGTEVSETKTDKLKAKLVWRTRTVRLTASHAFVDREDPFGRGLRNSFSTISGTLLSPFGTDEDITMINFFHNPTKNLSMTANYYRAKSEGGPQDMESTFQNYGFGANYKANDNLSVFGNYTHYSNEYEKDVYLGVLAPLLTITSLPYEGTGTTVSLGAWLWTDNFTFRPAWNFTRVESFFSDSNLGSGLSAINEVDATVNQLAMELGIPICEKMDINLGYYMDKYEDGVRPHDEGTVHWLFGWFNYKF